MSNFIYKEFLPINDTASLKEGAYYKLTIDEIKKWRNFKIITKSEYIANELSEEQNHICPACNQTIENSDRVIHHLDYMRLCKYLECFKTLKPTTKNPFRKVKTPKCSKCPETNICKEKIVLIHNNCHYRIHIIEGRIKKTKRASELIGTKKNQDEKLTYWRNYLTKDHKEIIQKSINIIRKLNPEKKFHLEYYTTYISLKPSNSVTFRISGNSIILTIKNGNFLIIRELLKKQEIHCNLKHKKSKPSNINFLINLNKFNENIYLLELVFGKIY